MNGPCAKQTVRCVILTGDGQRFEGTNACANPQPSCPRAPGEGYEKCTSICQQRGHAEIQALAAAGERAKNAKAFLFGHYYVCEPCAAAFKQAGVYSFEVTL
jgi:hypothetical protein